MSGGKLDRLVKEGEGEEEGATGAMDLNIHPFDIITKESGLERGRAVSEGTLM